MNQADLYNKYNSLQKNDAIFAINNYLRLIKWRNDGKENILDIGTGDGDVILNLLLPHFPKNFNQLTCTDSSEEMVKFARKKSFHRNVYFEKMDISSEETCKKFNQEFDHIFSFYCFHWIQQQKCAMNNIYNFLKPGGDILIIFLQNCPIFDIYEALAKTPKWGPYMRNVNKFVSPFHHSNDPEGDMELILKNAGFISRLCRVENRTFTYPSWDIVTKSMLAVNPFISKIAKNQLEHYIGDYLNEVRRNKVIQIEVCNNNNNNNNEETIHVPYKLFVIYASKPFS